MKDKYVEIKQLRETILELVSMVSKIEIKQKEIMGDLDLMDLDQQIKCNELEQQKIAIKLAVPVLEEKLERLQR